MNSTSATHLVAPFVEENGFRFVKKFDANFFFLKQHKCILPTKIKFSTKLSKNTNTLLPYLYHVLKEHRDHCTKPILLLIVVYNILLSSNQQ